MAVLTLGRAMVPSSGLLAGLESRPSSPEWKPWRFLAKNRM
jgi:hypothetical protein